MKLFGWELNRSEKAAGSLAPVDNRGGWWGLVRESFTGAWQQNVEVKLDSVLTYSAVFRCISLISSDIAKMRMRLVSRDTDGIWSEVDNPSFSPVLRKPNRYQTRIRFFESWVQSKLVHGNTYVLKGRDNRGVVNAMYVLDPLRVKVLVAGDGEVFYQLMRDDLSGQHSDSVTIPATEIIHDRWNTLHHPLVGTSPIYACGLAAVQGLRIQNNSANFFGNGAKPSGILTAEGKISPDDARALSEQWNTSFTGENAGKTAILADGLSYQPLSIAARDSQLIEQLKWSAETICSVFGVPAYMAGAGPSPTHNNIEALYQQYYSQCLQIHIESIEECLDDALGIGIGAPKANVIYGTEFDLDDLLRMDTATQIDTISKGVLGGLIKPDEGRRKIGLGKVEGGDAVYLQEQNYSLAALAKRDALADPWGNAPAEAVTPSPEPETEPEPENNLDDEANEDLAKEWANA